LSENIAKRYSLLDYINFFVNLLKIFQTTKYFENLFNELKASKNKSRNNFSEDSNEAIMMNKTNYNHTLDIRFEIESN